MNKSKYPLFEQDIETRRIKKLYKKELIDVTDLKNIFRDLRDYIAGNMTGITRDEKIAQNLMRILFCKIYDEKNKNPDDQVDFIYVDEEDLEKLERRINNLFRRVVSTYKDIFNEKEVIEFYGENLKYIVQKFQFYSFLNTERDVIGDAFEELIGRAFRGGEGQFFTPRNVVKLIVETLEPKKGDRIIDPACGSGGFLAFTLRHLLHNNVKDVYLMGLDKDAFLSRLTKIYLSILGNDEYHVYCENSLENPTKWDNATQSNIKLGTFDCVFTNPPFGAKIPVIGEDLLRQYKLGHNWKENKGQYLTTNEVLDKQPPQVLFIERCIQLLKPKGKMGIVLPEGIFGNSSDRYIWEYIKSEGSVIGVVSLSQETFQPSTHTKTSILFFEKGDKKRKNIFMSIAYNIGHDKNGKTTYLLDNYGNAIFDSEGDKILNDDLPKITHNFKEFLGRELYNSDHLGFNINSSDIHDHIYIPEYYNPEIKKELLALEKSGNYQLKTIQDLLNEKVLKISRGNEVGSHFYGTGTIPFVRTSDIVNWEIKVDPIKCVAEEVFDKYKKSQDIKEKDILFVSDGTFLIGRVAMVTRLHLKIIIQSHLKKIRTLKPEILDPDYLFYLLNTKIVRKQIDSKTFVQATISTIGDRLGEVVLPITKDIEERKRYADEIRDIINKKTELRERTLKLLGDESGAF